MNTKKSDLQLSENSSSNTFVSNVFLVIGVCIMLSALIYMIVNLHKADSIITMWLIFMVTGISLSLWGLIIKLITRGDERKKT
jgi:hypothetical protein